MSAPAPRLQVPQPADPPRRDPRAFRHGSAGSNRPQGPAGPRSTTRPSPRGGKPGGRPPRGPGGSGPRGRPKGAPAGTARRLPLALRLALLPIRLALVPLRLAGLVLGRITGGRPWLALVLVLGCGVIFLHAATLKTNQLIQQRDAEISALERSTAELRNSVVELGSTDRVSRVGREAGMVFPDPEGVGYLDASKANAERAAKTFGPPSAAWLPAPNRSSQNGDSLNEDGTVAEGGLGGTAGAAAVAPGSTGAGTTGESAGTTPAPTSAAQTTAPPTPTTATGAPDTTTRAAGTTAASGADAAPATTATSPAQTGSATGATGTTGTADGTAAIGSTGGATP